MENVINQIDFQKSGGLVPVIVQDDNSNMVLMLGYMNKEALKKTIESKQVYFWSRSRNALWLKGETSGNTLKAIKVFFDCDNDTILVKAKLNGTAVCHTGELSCFYQKLL